VLSAFFVTNLITKTLLIIFLTGNEAKTIQLTTHSGVLKASQDFPFITLDMPLNAPHPYEATNLQDLVKATTGELKLKDIKFCCTTRQLLFCLVDEYNLYDCKYSFMVKITSLNVLDIVITGRICKLCPFLQLKTC
jgi:hypothetical protein